MSDEQAPCAHCGAPRVAGFAACKFCKTPFVRNTQSGAIPCPKCSTLNELGVQKCVQCQTWIVVQCVFCSALSPHNLPGCQRCGEAFAGAPERFQQRQQAVTSQRNMQMIGTVGTVAASLVGAAAGAAIGSRSYGHGGYGHHHHHHGYDGGGFAHRQDGDWDQPSFGGSSSEGDGGSGGGIMDSLFGGSSDSGDSGSSGSSDGGDGGGIMDSLFGGSDDS